VPTSLRATQLPGEISNQLEVDIPSAAERDGIQVSISRVLKALSETKTFNPKIAPIYYKNKKRITTK